MDFFLLRAYHSDVRRFLPSFLVFLSVLSLFLGEVAFAATTDPGVIKSLVPNTIVTKRDDYEFDCVRFMKIPGLRNEVKKNVIDIKRALVKVVAVDKDYKIQVAGQAYSYPINDKEGTPIDLAISCGIKSGRFPLWLMPYVLVRAIDYLIYLAGMISVLFIVIGGYKWVVGGFTDDKESGKKTIKSAMLGLVISLVAYTGVNLLMYLLTS